MFEKGSYVIYKRDVCKIVDITNNKYTNKESYILEPFFDKSLKISIPTDDKNGYLRKLITKEEIEEVIKSIPKIQVLDINSHNLENEYRNLLHSGNIIDLIKIIKTTYQRNEQRTKAKRSIGEKDKEYFNKAEKYLYNELSVVLNLSYEETKNYVISKVRKMEDK